MSEAIRPTGSEAIRPPLGDVAGLERVLEAMGSNSGGCWKNADVLTVMRANISGRMPW